MIQTTTPQKGNMKKLLLATLAMIGTTLCLRAQSWVGSDNFNSGLNTTLWNTTYASGDNGTPGQANVAVSGGQLLYTSTSTTDDAYLTWNQPLPKTQSWLATVDVNVSSFAMTSTQYASASLYVADLSQLPTTLVEFGDKLAFDSSQGHVIVSSGTDITGPNFTSLNNFTLALGFNAQTDTLTSYYSLTTAQQGLQLVTINSTSGSGFNTFDILIGGQSENFSVPSGDIGLDNFSVTPEPSIGSLVMVGLVLLGAAFRFKRRVALPAEI